MLTKDLRIAPRANAGLGAPRAAYGASRGTRSPRASSRAERTPPWRGSAALRPIPAGARAYARGATCVRTARGTPAPLRYGTPRPTAPPVGWLVSTEPPGRSEGVPALRGARLWHRPAVPARHTHPPASSRAERLRLCEPHKSADRSQSRTSSSGWTSATAGNSSLRSPSPVLRDSSLATAPSPIPRTSASTPASFASLPPAGKKSDRRRPAEVLAVQSTRS